MPRYHGSLLAIGCWQFVLRENKSGTCYWISSFRLIHLMKRAAGMSRVPNTICKQIMMQSHCQTSARACRVTDIMPNGHRKPYRVVSGVSPSLDPPSNDTPVAVLHPTVGSWETTNHDFQVTTTNETNSHFEKYCVSSMPTL